VREKGAVEIVDVDGSVEGAEHIKLRFVVPDSAQNGKVSVSRVDGNHRLFYAAGDERRNPLLAMVPFQIHIGLTRDRYSSISTRTRRA
jgi:hypothetical protein